MALPKYTEPHYRIWHYCYIFICSCVFFFLIAPLFVIFPLSFNAEDVFNSCIEAVDSINLSDHGLQEYILKINSSFGPLKFDEPNLAVIHLMVYDLQSHRQHVILSPFTCLDWERSESVVGMRLQQIFPVGRLQPWFEFLLVYLKFKFEFKPAVNYLNYLI